MNFRQLELFVAVAETQSFSRGAERICLTQSTVSQHIAALEDDVNTRLFDRSRTGATLTAGGQVFLRHARRILGERQQLQQEMARFTGLAGGELKIGASNIPANHLLPVIFPQLAEQYPQISIHMQSGDSAEILERLLNAEFELAVVGATDSNRKFEFRLLADDLLVLIVSARHPWAKQPHVTLADLPTQPLVVRESGSGSEKALMQELLKVELDIDSLQIAVRLGSNEAVRQVVKSGYGYAFVSQRSVEKELERGELCQVAVSGLRVARQFWLVNLRGRSLSPAATVFSELLLKTYRPKEG